ncbi:Aspartic proteinase-like protein 2 [Nymphaea thermarum]|nr:Aspartic proteinase-like protein 2 [Nymphaea thermarum]
MGSRKPVFPPAFALCLVLLCVGRASANGVFRVKSKFAGLGSQIAELRAHDVSRHGRMLGDVDLPLGGIGKATAAGLYYTEIWLGNPSKKYYVQVDTGSDQLWVNCVQCQGCPKKSGLGLELTLYDPSGSSSGSLVSCRDDFCSTLYRGHLSSCTPALPCQYYLQYGDGSTSMGYFIKDLIQYNQVIGNLQTRSVNASVVFGCSVRQTGQLDDTRQALDGIIGFGQSDSSVISQLASAGEVDKMFAHCLDGINGGGIFAIGQVVYPHVKTTPLVANESHYNVYMKGIDVGGVMLQLPSGVADSGAAVQDRMGAIIDSGTTLAYIPEDIYSPLMNAIRSNGPRVEYVTVQGSSCFQFTGSVNDSFPYVTFYFENSVSMKEFEWCIGFQTSGGQSKDAKLWAVFGDLVLANRLVFYDLKNQAIGWTDYDCSTSIKVKDSKTGAVYSVGAHNISLACNLDSLRSPLILFLIIILHLIL